MPLVRFRQQDNRSGRRGSKLADDAGERRRAIGSGVEPGQDGHEAAARAGTSTLPDDVLEPERMSSIDIRHNPLLDCSARSPTRPAPGMESGR